MYLTMDAAIFVSLVAFMVIKWAIEKILNQDPFSLCLLVFTVLAAYQSSLKQSCSSTAPPLAVPTNDVSSDGADVLVYSDYLVLLKSLAPAFEAIEGCIAQLQARDELLGRLTSVGRSTMTLFCRRLDDQVSQLSRELRALEGMVCRAGAGDMTQGLQGFETSVGQLGDRADDVDARIEGQARDIAALRGEVGKNTLVLQTTTQLAEKAFADLSDLRVQLAETKVQFSSLATLGERLDKLEPDFNLKLDALVNKTTSIQTQLHQQAARVQKSFQAELQAVKKQFLDANNRHAKALEECKRAFNEKLIEQSKLFGEKSDMMQHEDTRLHDEIKNLRSELHSSEFRNNIDIFEHKVDFEANLEEKTQIFIDKLRRNADRLQEEATSSLCQRLDESKVQHEQAMMDHKTAWQRVLEQHVDGLAVKIQELSDAHQREMESLREEVGQRAESQTQHDENISAQTQDPLDLALVADPHHDVSKSEGGDSTSTTAASTFDTATFDDASPLDSCSVKQPATPRSTSSPSSPAKSTINDQGLLPGSITRGPGPSRPPPPDADALQSHAESAPGSDFDSEKHEEEPHVVNGSERESSDGPVSAAVYRYHHDASAGAGTSQEETAAAQGSGYESSKDHGDQQQPARDAEMKGKKKKGKNHKKSRGRK